MAKKRKSTRKQSERLHEQPDAPFDARKIVLDHHNHHHNRGSFMQPFGVCLMIVAVVVAFFGRRWVADEHRTALVVVAVLGSLLGLCCVVLGTRGTDTF
jgi:hypothetical protein